MCVNIDPLAFWVRSGAGWGSPGPVRTGMLGEEGPMDLPLEPLTALKCYGESAR